MNVYCIGVDHHRASLEQREQISCDAVQTKEALKALPWRLKASEVVLVSTCNRTEWYLASASPMMEVVARLQSFLLACRQITFDFLTLHYHHQNESCARHLFEVVSGLQSMVVGETEILGQVKSAYELALAEGSTGKHLNRLFQSSFSAAKEVRTHTAITRGSVSIASVSVELTEKIFQSLDEVNVLLLGVGDTGEKVAKSLHSRNASICLSNRTLERAELLATTLGADVIAWANWQDYLMKADVVIGSVTTQQTLIDESALRKVMHQRHGRPLFLIDLGVPRNFHPSLASIDSVYLYNLDDLQVIAQHHLAERLKEVEKCRRIVLKHEERFNSWFKNLHRQGLTL